MSTQPQVQQAGEPEHAGGRAMSRLFRIIFLIFVLVFVAVAIYLVTGVWGNFNNVLSFILSAVGSIAGVIGLWAILFPAREGSNSNRLNERAPQMQTTTPPQRAQVASLQPSVNDQVSQHIPFVAPDLSSQLDDGNEDTENLIHALINSAPSVFDAIIAYYNPPSGVAETGTKAYKARELVNTALSRDDLPKLIKAYYDAMGMKLPVKKKFRTD